MWLSLDHQLHGGVFGDLKLDSLGSLVGPGDFAAKVWEVGDGVGHGALQGLDESLLGENALISSEAGDSRDDDGLTDLIAGWEESGLCGYRSGWSDPEGPFNVGGSHCGGDGVVGGAREEVMSLCWLNVPVDGEAITKTSTMKGSKGSTKLREVKMMMKEEQEMECRETNPRDRAKAGDEPGEICKLSLSTTLTESDTLTITLSLHIHCYRATRYCTYFTCIIIASSSTTYYSSSSCGDSAPLASSFPYGLVTPSSHSNNAMS